MKNLGTPTVLDELQTRLHTVQLTDRALWGKMSAPQMVRHLACACEVALGTRPVSPVKNAIPPAMMKFLALRFPRPWPQNVPSTPELIREIEAPAPPTAIDADLAATSTRLTQIARARHLALSHPFFGRMSAADWQRWAYLHTDHHLRQFHR